MFSLGFHHKAMIISAMDINCLSCANVDKLRSLFIQSLRNPYKRIVIDLLGIESIDIGALQVLEKLHQLAINQGVKFEFINVNNRVRKALESEVTDNPYLISSGPGLYYNEKEIIKN